MLLRIPVSSNRQWHCGGVVGCSTHLCLRWFLVLLFPTSEYQPGNSLPPHPHRHLRHAAPLDPLGHGAGYPICTAGKPNELTDYSTSTSPTHRRSASDAVMPITWFFRCRSARCAIQRSALMRDEEHPSFVSFAQSIRPEDSQEFLPSKNPPPFRQVFPTASTFSV